MKQYISLKTIITVAAFFFVLTGYSQYELGMNFGAVVYQGDLTPEKFGSFKTQKFAVGLHADRILGHTFSIRGNLLISKLHGDDGLYDEPAYRQQRNFNFTSSLVEISASFVFNLTAKNYADKGLSPYVFGGAGLSFLHIKRDWSQLNRSYFDPESHTVTSGLAEDSAHSLPRVIPVIPFGGGLRYFLNTQWGINAEVSYRLSYTDYIDGFSHAANPDLNDHYLNYAIGIIYRPGQDNKNRMGCPVIRY